MPDDAKPEPVPFPVDVTVNGVRGDAHAPPRHDGHGRAFNNRVTAVGYGAPSWASAPAKRLTPWPKSLPNDHALLEWQSRCGLDASA